MNAPTEAPGRTDFATWDRKVLEQFARQAADENQALRAQLQDTQALRAAARSYLSMGGRKAP